MEETEREIRIGSEVATLAAAVVLLVTAGLPDTPAEHRAGLLVAAALLAVFAGIWFHAVPASALGRLRFGVGAAVVQVILTALLALTGGVASDYFAYALLPILVTAFAPPLATVVTASVALLGFAALATAALFAPTPPRAALLATGFFAIVAVSAMTALIARVSARTRTALGERTRELSLQNRELDIVRRAALALGQARDQEELVEATFAAAREGTRADMVLMLIAVGGGFRGGIAATERGVDRFDTDPGLTRSPGRQAVRDRRTVLVADAVAEGTQLSPEIRDRLQLRAGIFVPLVARDQAFGIVVFARTVPTRWTAEEIRLAEAIADASAGAVAGYAAMAELRLETEALAERSRVLEGIDRLGDALAVARGEEDAALSAARGLADTFRLRGATTLLVDPSRAILEPCATAGETRQHDIVSDPGSCPAIRLGRAFRVEGAHSALACPFMPTDGPGYLCLPLLAAGEPVGALFLEPLDVAAIDDRAGRAAADRVALTVGNARVLKTARRQATTDGLTGLYNRRFFEEQMRVAHSLAERHGEPYSLIAIDLDGLKTLNDMMGHEAGDEALREFAATLRTTLRGSDVAARIGGDEFVVLASRTAVSEAVLTAERILAELEGRSRTRPRLRISMSAGVASWRLGRSSEAVIQAADAMLYKAKSDGRARVVAEEPPAAPA